MKRKILIIAVAVLLSGCANKEADSGYTSLAGKQILDETTSTNITSSLENPEITESINSGSTNRVEPAKITDSIDSTSKTVPKNISETAISTNSEQTLAAFETPVSEPDIRQTSAEFEETVSEPDFEQSSDITESLTSTVAVSKPETAQTNVYTLSYDPLHSRKIFIEGNTMTLSGMMGPFKVTGVAIDNNYIDLIPCDISDEEFSCKISVDDMTEGYHSIKTVYENQKYDGYRIFLGENGFEIPFSPEIETSNDKVFSAPEELSAEAVARYITIGGDRNKCREILGEIQKLSDKICEGLTNDYDKLRAISDWTAYNIFYDYPAHDMGIPDECLSLEYMLKNKTSVCGGYSNMTSALCAAQGIECFNVKGKAVQNGRCYREPVNGVYHEWNYAVIDSRRIIIDTGWNSQSFYHGGNDFRQGAASFKYFDISPDFFALDHQAESAEHRNYSMFTEDEQ